MSGDAIRGTTVFAGIPDLARADLGGRALLSSDAFFAGPENLCFPHEPVWDAERYTDRGKWMDGWEPRRRRAPGHDWCIVQLGAPGDLVGVDIDTRHFLGNAPPYASLEACRAPADADPEWLRDHAEWIEVLSQVGIDRGGHNVFAVRPFEGATHVRLHIYPAGGVARLRVHARPRPTPLAEGERGDLAGVLRGAKALACSDMFFSRMDNLLLPQPAPHMGHGWETKRSALPREDWVVVELGQPGRLDEIVLDTKHFKGNYPESARVEGLYWPGAQPWALTKSDAWRPVVASTRLTAHAPHSCPVVDAGPWTHLRLVIESDGGVSRMRALGAATADRPGDTDPLVSWLNGLDDVAASEALARCCGSRRWVAGMVAARPFASRTHLHGAAEQIWWALGDGDWHEAFTHHPRIGADPDALRAKFGATADWSEGEQAGVAAASEETIQALAQGNRDYEARFGHIFIVCASGLRADTMLSMLQARMPNAPEFELRVAAGEQAKITALRLEKLEPATSPEND